MAAVTVLFAWLSPSKMVMMMITALSHLSLGAQVLRLDGAASAKRAMLRQEVRMGPFCN